MNVTTTILDASAFLVSERPKPVLHNQFSETSATPYCVRSRAVGQQNLHAIPCDLGDGCDLPGDGESCYLYDSLDPLARDQRRKRLMAGMGVSVARSGGARPRLLPLQSFAVKKLQSKGWL